MDTQINSNNKSVVVFLADGFEEIEAIAFTDILRRANINTTLVSINESTIVTGAHGITINADITIAKLDLNCINAVVLPGGMPGTLNLQACKKVLAAINYAVDSKMLIGAICAAPMILGELGLLMGRKATCYPGFEEKLLGSNTTGERVVKDGIFITSKGAGTAHDFASAFINEIKDRETAIKVISSMQY